MQETIFQFIQLGMQVQQKKIEMTNNNTRHNKKQNKAQGYKYLYRLGSGRIWVPFVDSLHSTCLALQARITVHVIITYKETKQSGRNTHGLLTRWRGKLSLAATPEISEALKSYIMGVRLDQWHWIQELWIKPHTDLWVRHMSNHMYTSATKIPAVTGKTISTLASTRTNVTSPPMMTRNMSSDKRTPQAKPSRRGLLVALTAAPNPASPAGKSEYGIAMRNLRIALCFAPASSGSWPWAELRTFMAVMPRNAAVDKVMMYSLRPCQKAIH